MYKDADYFINTVIVMDFEKTLYIGTLDFIACKNKCYRNARQLTTRSHFGGDGNAETRTGPAYAAFMESAAGNPVGIFDC